MTIEHQTLSALSERSTPGSFLRVPSSLARDGKPRMAIEIKRSTAPVVSGGFDIARADLRIEQRFVVYPGTWSDRANCVSVFVPSSSGSALFNTRPAQHNGGMPHTPPLSKSALLVIDVQHSFTHMPYWPGGEVAPFQRSLLRLEAGCRKVNVPVVHIFHVDDDPPFQVASGHVRPLDWLPGDPAVAMTKHTHNAFTDTGLDLWLRRRGSRCRCRCRCRSRCRSRCRCRRSLHARPTPGCSRHGRRRQRRPRRAARSASRSDGDAR